MERRREENRFFLLIMTVLFAVGTVLVLPQTVKAESDSRDGLEVTVETDKEEYAIGEEIQVFVKVANNSTEALNNITIDLDIPEGVKLAEGLSTRITIASLAQGEVKATELKAEAVEAVNTAITANANTAVKTGDTQVPVAVWIVMAVSLAGGILLLVKPEHRKKAAKLSGILAFTAGVALFSGMVYAYTVVFEIHKTITIGGIEKTIHVIISYEIGGKGDTPTEDVGKDTSTESTDENTSTEDSEEEEGVKWKFEDGTLTIYGKGEMDDYGNGKNVPWNDYRNEINNVVIEDGVINIGSDAFCGCRNLSNIEISESVTSIGESAFGDCYSLTNIEIPESVTSIEKWTFFGCVSLTSVKIPEGVTSIEELAFAHCQSLTNIEIPESVVNIGDKAFFDCKSMITIEIPSGITNIGIGTFSNCTSLTSIKIPESVTSIGAEAFAGCSSLTSVEIPSSVISIGESAFDYDFFYSNTCGLTTIYGTAGSYAETYANEHSYTFIAK